MDGTICGPNVLVRDGKISSIDRSVRTNCYFLASESLDVLLTTEVFEDEFFSRNDVSFEHSLQQCAL